MLLLVLLPAPTATKVPVVLAYRVRVALECINIYQHRPLTPTARPDVHFHCDINRDPFLFMEEHNKTYCAFPFLIMAT